MKNKNTTERHAPIQDGDTRPDQNLEGKRKKEAGSPVQSKKQPVTKERSADTDTREDYKDAAI